MDTLKKQPKEETKPKHEFYAFIGKRSIRSRFKRPLGVKRQAYEK